jgi:hypothetical protein
MQEEAVFIPAREVSLEGRYCFQTMHKGVLVCHPHPEYGGEMSNNVVQAVVEAFSSLGWTTLRFNFRGVGQSSGRYSKGVGEQEDVRAAYAFLKEKGLNLIIVAGYSFGGWVAARVVKELEAGGLLLVSPPVALMDFSFKDLGISCWIVYGERDPFCPEDQLKNLTGATSCIRESRSIPGADHFYWGYEQQIQDAIKRWFGETPTTYERAASGNGHCTATEVKRNG